jgi:hypothetical protein
MNTDVDELLREGMERFTRDLRAPTGLLDRVTRRRRRSVAQRSAYGVAAVLAAAGVALVAVVVPGAGGGAPALAAAYVVKRVHSALSAAEPGDIAQITVTTSGSMPSLVGHVIETPTAEEWSYGDRWRSVSYSPAGKPVFDEGFSSSSVFTFVSYLGRAWARERGLGRPLGLEQFGARAFESGPAGVSAAPEHSPTALIAAGVRACDPLIPAVQLLFEPGLPGVGFTASAPPATAARALLTAASCGTLRVAGPQRVDGIEATRLTSRPDSPISETIWVSPGTYLPVRVTVSSAFGPPSLELTADITWLQPTKPNLARLAVPVPAGFRHVSLPEAVGLTLPQTPGGQPKNIVLCRLYAAGPHC